MAAESEYVNKRISNVKSNIIEITEDKLKLILREELPKTKYLDRALCFLGIFMTLLLTLCTAEFKDTFGINKSTIHAIVIILSVSVGITMVVYFVKSLGSRGDNIIERIKKSEI